MLTGESKGSMTCGEAVTAGRRVLSKGESKGRRVWIGTYSRHEGAVNWEVRRHRPVHGLLKALVACCLLGSDQSNGDAILCPPGCAPTAVDVYIC